MCVQPYEYSTYPHILNLFTYYTCSEVTTLNLKTNWATMSKRCADDFCRALSIYFIPRILRSLIYIIYKMFCIRIFDLFLSHTCNEKRNYLYCSSFFFALDCIHVQFFFSFFLWKRVYVCVFLMNVDVIHISNNNRHFDSHRFFT